MKIDYNKFNLSHEAKLSFDAGYLVPILVQEVLPGDRFRIDPQVFVRCQPLIAPVMHRLDVFTYFFYVPNRIIWDDAEEFYTRGRDMDSIVTAQRLEITNNDKSLFAPGLLPDYMGIPPIDQGDTVNGTHYVAAAPFLAYQKIYLDVFRPQEVQDDEAMQTASGDIGTGPYLTQCCQMRRRPWPKDYFTDAKVQAILNPDLYAFVPAQPITDEESIYKTSSEYVLDNGTLSGVNNPISEHGSDTGQLYQTAWPGGRGRIQNLEVGAWPDDFMGIGIDIDNIRRVSALQRWIESLINVGYRYPDYLWATWRVKSQDARLDRPEYLGGSATPLRISEVLNTSATATESQGEMAGHGIASGNGKVINSYHTEHGWIIGLICVVPKAAYAQGMDKFWTKWDHLDFANPYLANLGAQYLLSDELYYSWTQTQDDNRANFGYQKRYAEYKSRRDRYHGKFRDELSFWHFGRDFSVRPTLNLTFCACQPKTSAFASASDPYMAQIYFNMSVLRKLPVYASLEID